MVPRQKIRIGDLLVDKGLITPEQLSSALQKQQQQGGKLGEWLINLEFISEQRLLQVLSEQFQLPYLDLRRIELQPSLIKLLPESHARRYRAIVVSNEGEELVVGMNDPQDLMALDELARVLKRPFKLALVESAPLLKAIDFSYRRTEEISQRAAELSKEIANDAAIITGFGQDDADSDAPVVRLLQSLFEEALQIGASDIHIEPDESVLRLRLRVDGYLQEQVMDQKEIASALTQRLKLISGLNISEKRLPQDGRFNIRIKDKAIDVRLSTLPTQHGESVVMRLLDQSSGLKSLEKLGMPSDMVPSFRSLLHRPHGLILVTGPTGSGKTTTLYSALNEINTPEKKIITVEDPVEYRISRLNQVQVYPKIGLTFETVLKAALRQDPDILLLGEIRNSETASIALRAAMTGHLVLATLHTNDAHSTAMRLIDMGVESFLVGTALKAVLAQRLVRRLCPHCREPSTLTEEYATIVEKITPGAREHPMYYRAVGCSQCARSGYAGRIGVYELLLIRENLANALRSHDPTLFYQTLNESGPRRSLAAAALEYAQAGLTTVTEAIRLSEEIDDR